MIALFSDLRLLYAIGDPVEIEDFESAIAKITERADDLDHRARTEGRFWHHCGKVAGVAVPYRPVQARLMGTENRKGEK